MLLLGLFIFSLILGGIVFVAMLGRDAWLIKGLRRDDVTAILVACILLVVGLALFAGLRTLLTRIPHALAAALAPVPQWSPEPLQTATETPFADAAGWFLSLCAPVLASFLLYGIYSTGCWVVRCLSRDQIDEVIAIRSNRR